GLLSGAPDRAIHTRDPDRQPGGHPQPLSVRSPRDGRGVPAAADWLWAGPGGVGVVLAVRAWTVRRPTPGADRPGPRLWPRPCPGRRIGGRDRHPRARTVRGVEAYG